MSSAKKQFILAVFLLLIFSLGFIALFGLSHGTRGTRVSRESQIVRDYLDGKSIRKEDAWWLRVNDATIKNSIVKSVAKELKLDGDYILKELDNYYVVRKPQKE